MPYWRHIALVLLAAGSTNAGEPGRPVAGTPAIIQRIAAAVAGIGEELLAVGDFSGPVQARRVRFRFLELHDARATLTRRGGRWGISDISGRFYDGTLSGALAVWWDAEKRSVVELEFNVKDADLEALLAACGVAGQAGRLSGRLKLCVRGGETAGVLGEGSVYVKDARLAKVPLIAQMIGIVGAPSLRETNMNAAEAHFTLLPRGVVFQGLEFTSEDGALTLRAERNGAVLYDGQIRMAIQPVVDARILSGMRLAGELASEILRALEGRMARVIIEGHVKQPTVSWRPTR